MFMNCVLLKDSFRISHIIFRIECEPIELELSCSLPLGLILNEAITNSIKYAFPGNKEGTIKIILSHLTADSIRMIIADNGIGIPMVGDRDSKLSMGLNLMEGLTGDIGGTFVVKRENGTIIQIDFAYEEVKHNRINENRYAGS